MDFRPPSDISTPALYRLLQPICAPSSSSRAQFTNWGRTFSCTPLAVFEPENENQAALVLELARREGKRVRFAGVGHSPSDLACTSDFMLRTTKFNKLLEVDADKHLVTVQAGITLSDLHDELAHHGLAMSNLGSICDQTLAGVIATPTHGSGVTFGILCSNVRALTLLLADGSRVSCSSTDRSELFQATLCGLGATGLILSATLQCEPAFRLKEVQNTVDFDDFITQFDDLVFSAEHVRFWWFCQNGKVRTSMANRTNEAVNPAGSWLWHRFFGYHVVQLLLFIGRFFLVVNTWTAMFAEWLIRGETIGIDDSRQIFNVDCRYPQFTTEWALPLRNARQCLLMLRKWFDEEFSDPDGLRPHFPIEIRTTEKDDIWLSPCYGERMCWIGIVQYKPYAYNVPYRALFSKFEGILSQYGGKPHWAKAHTLRPAAIRQLYPRFDDYVRVLEEVDPTGMFRNEYVRRHIFGERGREVHERIFKPLVQ